MFQHKGCTVSCNWRPKDGLQRLSWVVFSLCLYISPWIAYFLNSLYALTWVCPATDGLSPYSSWRVDVALPSFNIVLLRNCQKRVLLQPVLEEKEIHGGLWLAQLWSWIQPWVVTAACGEGDCNYPGMGHMPILCPMGRAVWLAALSKHVEWERGHSAVEAVFCCRMEGLLSRLNNW